MEKKKTPEITCGKKCAFDIMPDGSPKYYMKRLMKEANNILAVVNIVLQHINQEMLMKIFMTMCH